MQFVQINITRIWRIQMSITKWQNKPETFLSCLSLVLALSSLEVTFRLIIISIYIYLEHINCKLSIYKTSVSNKRSKYEKIFSNILSRGFKTQDLIKKLPSICVLSFLLDLTSSLRLQITYYENSVNSFLASLTYNSVVPTYLRLLELSPLHSQMWF